MPIETLRVRALHGIRDEVRVDLAGKSLLVVGDNGTGKSSLVRALLWALCSEGGPDSEYGRHRRPAGVEPGVEITLTGGGSIVVGASRVDEDQVGARYRAACRRSKPYLVRRDLLRFLDDRPGERYQYLESFLDLRETDALQDAVVARQRKLELAATQAADALAAIVRDAGSKLPAARRAGVTTWSGVVDALGRWVVDLGLAAAAPSFEQLMDLAAVQHDVITGDTAAERRRALRAAMEVASRWRLPAGTTTSPSELLDRVAALTARTTDAEAGQLLTAALAFVERRADGPCPVCEAPAPDLASRLRARVDDLRELHATTREVEAVAGDWRAAFVTCASSTDRAPPATPWSEGAASTDVLRAIVTVGPDTVRESLRRHVSNQVARLRITFDALPPEPAIDERRDLVAAILAANARREECERALAASSRAARVATGMKAVVDALRRARQDVVTRLIEEEIGGLVKELYEAIHPPEGHDEVTGAPELDVQRQGRGTAFVRGMFAQDRVDTPLGIYSDGHTDTVAICVFLAMRRFRADRDRAADPKILILDDIVLSVDLTHAERLLDVLATRFSDHQILIFTHNRLFNEWCTRRLPQAKRLVIRSWSLDGGPQILGDRSSIERLERALDHESSPKVLAQAIVNALEPWLDEARVAYAISVQSKPGDKYDFPDLWDPFVKKQRENLKKRSGAVPFEGLLKRLSGVRELRNLLAAHHNQLASDYSLAQVHDVAAAALGLIRLFSCPAHGIVRAPREVTEPWKCGCGKVNLG